METIRDNADPTDDYWRDYDSENENFDESPKPHAGKLIEGISLKDLCSGKELMFNSEKGFPVLGADDDISDEVAYCDMKSLRENRGAPPLNRSFKEIASKMINVTENGFVKKQLVSSGVGRVVPDQAFVTVHYNLYKESCELPFDSTYMRNRPEKFNFNQGETLMGLESAIKTMKKNENSIFFIKWEMAFGAIGCPDRIERMCDIVADITLLDFVEMKTGQESNKLSGGGCSIDFSKSISQAKKLLCSGSEEFLRGGTRLAAASYRKALNILNGLRLANEEQEKIMLKEKVKCLVNLAICYNKLSKYEQACLVCQEVLSIDSNCVKANFHYGRANIALSNFSSAKKYLLRANRLKPNDKDINAEIKKLDDKKALYQMKDKMFCTKALSKEEDNSQEKPSPLEGFEEPLLSTLEESTPSAPPSPACD